MLSEPSKSKPSIDCSVNSRQHVILLDISGGRQKTKIKNKNQETMDQVCWRWIDASDRHQGENSIGISLGFQIGFSAVYMLIYAIFFRNVNSVTMMHMFVWYINTSTWGWGIYCFCYLVVCQGPIDVPLCIAALSVLGVLVLCSCIEMCCSREGGYFRHQKTMNQCIQYMKDMKETAPIHRIDIECYHYVTTYHTYTDSNGNTKTRTQRRRVTSHEEWRNFPYDTWSDESDYPNLPEISMKWPIVAVESNYIVAPGDDYTLNKFDIFRSNFLAEMRRRDDYIDETITTEVPGHIAQVTAKSEKEGEVPCWLDSGLFYCLATLFISCPLRVLFRSRAKKHEFEVRKLYYVEPSRAIGMGNTNITVNVLDNRGTVDIRAALLEGISLEPDIRAALLEGNSLDAASIPMLPYPSGGQMSMRCPNGHNLKLIESKSIENTLGRTWRCDGCQNFKKDQDVWRCDQDQRWHLGGTCKFDICTNCQPGMQSSPGYETVNIGGVGGLAREMATNSCPSGHDLKLVKNWTEKSWRCNACRVTRTDTDVWRCEYDKRSESVTRGTCDYDICTNCRPIMMESPPGYETGYNPASAPPPPPPPYNPNM